MAAAVTRISWYGGGAAEPAGTNAQDNPGLIFNREDSRLGNAVATGVPIPLIASTLYSWPKLVALEVTVVGTTNIANRRFSLASAMPVGMHWYVRGLLAYVQPAPVGDNVTTDAVAPQQAAPAAAPALAAAGSGGTWTAQTGWVKVTYTGIGGGETTPSPVASQAVGANGTLTISPPPTVPGAGGWYAYVGVGAAEPADAAKYRQQAAGAPTALGTNLVLAANPAAAGANPPAANNAAAYIEATVVNTPLYDNTSVSTAALGRNGGFCQMVVGMDSQYASHGGLAGTVVLPTYRLMYDEA